MWQQKCHKSLKNPIQYSRTKHIEIRHHFIRDHVQNKNMLLEFVSTEDQLVDIFIKPLNTDRFEQIRRAKTCLPYGMVFTLLFQAIHIDLNGEDGRQLHHSDTYSAKSLMRIGYHLSNGH